jgi:hypothetical protein
VSCLGAMQHEQRSSNVSQLPRPRVQLQGVLECCADGVAGAAQQPLMLMSLKSHSLAARYMAQRPLPCTVPHCESLLADRGLARGGVH